MILSLGLFGLVADAHTKVITVPGTKLTDPPTIKEWMAYDVKTLHLRFSPAGGRGWNGHPAGEASVGMARPDLAGRRPPEKTGPQWRNTERWQQPNPGNDPADDWTHVACLQIGEVVAGYHRTADLGSSFFAFGSPADDPLLAGTATGNRRRFGVRFFQAAVKINELTVKRFA